MEFPTLPSGVFERIKNEIGKSWRSSDDLGNPRDGIAKISGLRYLVSRRAFAFFSSEAKANSVEVKTNLNCRIYSCQLGGYSSAAYLFVFESESDCMIFEITHRIGWQEREAETAYDF